MLRLRDEFQNRGLLVSAEHTDEHLMPLIESLLSMGCHQQNIVVRTIPSIFDVVIATQFFAEYTDVDGVVILAPENKIMGTLSVMNGIVQIQVQWNMVVTVGGANRAEDIVQMVEMQNEMEEVVASPGCRWRSSLCPSCSSLSFPAGRTEAGSFPHPSFLRSRGCARFLQARFPMSG